jgi:hypothetical protein
MKKYLIFFLINFCILFGKIETVGSIEKGNSRITFITTTSVIPSHPSTSMLEISLKSFFQISGFEKIPKIIVFDEISKDKRYDEYKKRVIKLLKTNPHFKNTMLIFLNEHHHITGAIRVALKYVKTKYLFIHQHDFQLIKPFDLDLVLDSMELNPDIKHVRLNKRRNIRLGYDFYIDEYKGKTKIPLTRTFGWSDNDHITRKDYYENFVIPKVGNKKIPMEWALHGLERKDLKEDTSKHSIYGTFLLGALNEPAYIRHLNGKYWVDPKNSTKKVVKK